MPKTLAQILQEREGLAAPELVVELGDKKVQCFACGHRCKIPEGRDGICKVRRNVGGALRVPRGYVAGLQVDPIEKKPFFHVLPGNDALSFGMLGCDLHCAYCFPGDVRVTTTTGSRRLDELFETGALDSSDEGRRSAPADLAVIGDDGSEHRVRWLFRHHHEGDLVEVRTRLLPGFDSTPDHPVLATARPGAEPPRFVPVGSLTVGSYLAIPRIHAFGSPLEIDTASLLRRRLGTVKVRRRVAPETVQRIEALSEAGSTSREIGTQLGLRADFVRHVRSRLRRRGGSIDSLGATEERLVFADGRVRYGQERRPGIPETLQLDTSLAELLGLYCAEGCVLPSKGRPNSRSLTFSFSHAEEPLAKRTIQLLGEVFGVDARVSWRATTCAVITGKTSVATVFEALCNSGATKKHIPAEVFHGPRDVAESFLEALVTGDGHRYGDGKVSLTTVSEALAWDAVALVTKLGFLPSLYVNARPEDGIIQGRQVRQQTRQFIVVWRTRETTRRTWRADDSYWYVPVRSLSRRSFAGWVYNLEVEGRNSYLANGLAVHNCQNWVTSQALRDPVAGTQPRDVTPEQIVGLALREDAPVLVSTYNEPLITAEWAVEVFREGKRHGLMGAFVSNGNATPEVLDFIRPFVQAYKIDLKSFDDKRYRGLGAPLEHILEGLRLVHAKGFHLEVVSLLIPGFNDSDVEVRKMARFLASLSRDIPWHVTGFHDDYKMDSQGDTPASTLVRACEIGVEEGLRYVYAGNRPGQVGEWENTRCAGCRTTLIRRHSYKILEQRIGPEGTCPDCGTRIPGIWDHPRRSARPPTAPALPRRVM